MKHFRDKGNFGKAIQFLDIAISRSKQSFYYIERGKLYCNLKDYQKAISDFSKALEIDPTNISIYLERGKIWLLAYKNTTQAKKDFIELLKRSKDYDLTKEQYHLITYPKFTYTTSTALAYALLAKAAKLDGRGKIYLEKRKQASLVRIDELLKRETNVDRQVNLLITKAKIAAALGDTKEVIKHLKLTLSKKKKGFSQLRDIVFDYLQDHPQFKSLLNEFEVK